MGIWICTRGRCRDWVVMMGFCLLCQGGGMAQAGPLYVYTDGQGQAVLTDNLQQVPAEFRGRVRTMANGEVPGSGAQPASDGTTLSRSAASQGVIGDILTLVAAKVGSRQIKGFTAYQTAVVMVAGFCGLTLLVLIFLSSNPAVRLLCKCSLVLVGVAAVYHFAVVGSSPIGIIAGTSQPGSEQQAMDNVMGKMKSKTEHSYRTQDARTASQLEQIEPSAP